MIVGKYSVMSVFPYPYFERKDESSDDLIQRLKDFAKRADRDDKDWSIH